MEMDQQERESDVGDESPVSHNDEEMTDGEGESGRDQDDADSCDEIRRHANNAMMLADHGDVLAKLKMQEDFENGRHLGFPALTARTLPTQEGTSFHLPPPFPFPHPNTPFMTPLLPPAAAPSSGSSHSSEGSASSQHTWSFEEQFKQVRQLYEINDDPKRKEFLDDLFSFMQKRGTPINRLPIMAKSVLDLYELYNLVIARGGLVDVINKKLWQEIIKGLHLPSSITSAAFTLRTQYMKYLYPYECEKRRLSTPAELQAAIDGNRREGRRSSYGQYESMQRSPNPSQMSPLSLVSQQQQQQLAVRMNAIMSGGIGLHNGAHHPSHPPPLSQPLNGGPVPGIAPHELEARMLEYMRILNKDPRASTTNTSPGASGGGASGTNGQDDTTLQNALSPTSQLEMSRLALWNLYNSQTPAEPQKEALNLADTSQSSTKREAESREETPPPKKFSKDDSSDDVKTISPNTTHIKINSRGDIRNGDSNSLVVSMELNGVTYQGVLFAQTSPSSSRPEITS